MVAALRLGRSGYSPWEFDSPLPHHARVAKPGKTRYVQSVESIAQVLVRIQSRALIPT